MSDHHAVPRSLTARRVLPVGAAAALALGIGVLPSIATPARDPHAVTAHATARQVSAAQVQLRLAMRALWTDHVVWTRQVIVDFAGGLPTLDASSARLLKNQDDIGAAVAAYYGAPAGRALTALLREHIAIAVDVLKAAKASDTRALTAAQARWGRNADQIAAFLTAANPRVWKAGPTRAMMHQHLALTTAEAVARLRGDGPADVAAFDATYAQAIHMADMLADGIVKQFPKRFR